MARKLRWLDEPGWSLQERSLARGKGRSRQAGSGSKRLAKGDVRVLGWLIEAKETTKASMSIKMKWLDKITEEARERSLRPALAIRFSGTKRRRRDWVAVPRDLFEEVLRG